MLRDRPDLLSAACEAQRIAVKAGDHGPSDVDVIEGRSRCVERNPVRGAGRHPTDLLPRPGECLFEHCDRRLRGIAAHQFGAAKGAPRGDCEVAVAFLDRHRIQVRRSVVGGAVPVGIAHDLDALAGLAPDNTAVGSVAHHVGAGECDELVVGRRHLAVVLAGVLRGHGRRDRHDQRGRYRRCGGPAQAKHDRPIVGRLDARDPLDTPRRRLRRALNGAEV